MQNDCANCKRLGAELAQLQLAFAALLARVQDLEAQLAQTSKTSSQPPSQDKPWLPKSERQKSG
ncbi:DUF6444 domain-containing protein, partial [Deinococcus marmoris]|uniref:DUF6444 domain-containing protein n=1 Tax=Deinococcus marmoris TaxID=249408 RepID=UPI003CCBEBF3